MVKLYSSLLFFCLSFASIAQIQFVKIYSDIGFEKGEGITQLADSSYLVTGSSTSFQQGPPKAFLMKLDSLGNHKWAKHYGGEEINEGKRVFAIENHGYFIGGNTNSNTNADHNFYFIKTDENGDVLFEKQIGTPAWDFMNDGILLADSSFILTGETYNTPDGLEDAYTIRIDKNGDTLWTNQSNKPGIDKIYAADNVGDTAFVLAGTVWNGAVAEKKSFLGFYRYDNSVIWEKEYGEIGDYEIKDVDFWNNVFSCVGNRVFITDSLKDEYAVRVNLQGDTLSSFSYLEYSDKSMNKIVKYGNSTKFYVSSSQVNIYTLGTGDDFLIGRYDDFLGYESSAIEFKRHGQDDLGDLISTSDQGAIMVGTNRSDGSKNANVFLLKIGPNDLYPNTFLPIIVQSLVSLKENKDITNGFGFYPNPTSGIIYFQGFIDSGELRIINAMGQIKKVSKVEESKKLVEISDLKEGIYHLEFISDSGNKSFLGKIVKQ